MGIALPLPVFMWPLPCGCYYIANLRIFPQPFHTAAGEKKALRERMEAAILVESIDNSNSPFCLFCSKDGGSACAR